MTLQEYFRVGRERWKTVLALTLTGLVVGLMVVIFRAPTYTANLTLYVAAQTGDSASTAYQGSLLSQERVKSYSELVNSPRVTSEVVAELGLTESPNALARDIVATSAEDSVLIDVAVSTTDPVESANVANAVGAAFTRLVNDLERPLTPGALQPVAVKIVQPAPVPATASSMGATTLVSLAVVAGIAVGLLASLLQNAFDRKVRTSAQLLEATSAPELGLIEYDSDALKSTSALESQNTANAEAYRTLRTNLQFLNVDKPPQAILVTSSIPSEGKTTTTANLALVLATGGSRVVVVDGDLRRPRMMKLFHVEGQVGVTSVLSGRIPLREAVQRTPTPGLDLLASGPRPPNPSELLASQNMKMLISELRGQYDSIIIDTPPLLAVTDAAALSQSVDGVILVCRCNTVETTQIASAMQRLSSVSANLLGTIFTVVPRSRTQPYSHYMDYGPEKLNSSPEDDGLPVTEPQNRPDALRLPPVPYRRG